MPRKLPPQIETTTLWEFPSQHYGPKVQGSPEFQGATPSFVIWNLLMRYTRPGDWVLDPMCGSGTTIDVCQDLGRRGIGTDLTPFRRDIIRADARNLPIQSKSIDFAFLDPPYSTHLDYSTHPACIGRLDANSPEYYRAMDTVFRELFRVLRPRRYLGLYCCDSYRKGRPFCAIGFGLYQQLQQYFRPVDVITVVRHNRTLKRSHWHQAAISGNYFLRGFNYLLLFKKEAEELPSPGHRS